MHLVNINHNNSNNISLYFNILKHFQFLILLISEVNAKYYTITNSHKFHNLCTFLLLILISTLREGSFIFYSRLR